MHFQRREMSKYGLPRHIVHGTRPPFVSHVAEVCLRERDELQGYLLDALAAYKAAIIGSREYDREHARLRRAIWLVEKRYEDEYRKKWRSKKGRG